MGLTASVQIAVLGAGSWGTALAILLARNGHRVRLWGHEPAEVETLSRDRSNEHYLPGIRFPDNLMPCYPLQDAVRGCDYLLVAVPSHAFRSVLRALAQRDIDNPCIAWATKGLETGSGKFLHQILAEELNSRWTTAVISGPTFATEVAKGLPTAVTVASADSSFAERVADSLHGTSFRAYTSDDVIGVELGGAAKNVLAIAAGISDGLGFGANARAALITRGLSEIMRLGEALGGRRETFMGLAGIGDLVLTCTDDQSRNRRLGMALGRGESLDKAVRDIGQAVEGVHTATELLANARRHDVEMPITEQVCKVLNEGLTPAAAVEALLMRGKKVETV